MTQNVDKRQKASLSGTKRSRSERSASPAELEVRFFYPYFNVLLLALPLLLQGLALPLHQVRTPARGRLARAWAGGLQVLPACTCKTARRRGRSAAPARHGEEKSTAHPPARLFSLLLKGMGVGLPTDLELLRVRIASKTPLRSRSPALGRRAAPRRKRAAPPRRSTLRFNEGRGWGRQLESSPIKCVWCAWGWARWAWAGAWGCWGEAGAKPQRCPRPASPRGSPGA